MKMKYKFRVWDTLNNKWITTWNDFAPLFAHDNPIAYCNIWTIREYNAIWQQFSGLTDVNGKEIYEGDIILRANLKAIVQYATEEASFIMWYPELEDWVYLSDFSDLEIVGNIFENPLDKP